VFFIVCFSSGYFTQGKGTAKDYACGGQLAIVAQYFNPHCPPVFKRFCVGRVNIGGDSEFPAVAALD
jgi:hypothetical protein